MKIATFTFLLWSLTRLLKTGSFNALLAAFGIPPLPKNALPWVALLLGSVASVLDAMALGVPPGEAVDVVLRAVVDGVLSGAGAITFEETVVTASVRAYPSLGRLLGKTKE
jgi:hypothetical protein